MKISFVYGAYENLGIEYLSAVLKQAGHKTELIFDSRLFDDHYTQIRFLSRLFNNKKRIIQKIIDSNPGLLAFSVVTDDYIWACDIASEIKRRLDVPVVFGGIHPTSVPERIIQKDCVDFVIIGEGEYALLELVEKLENKRRDYKIENLWAKQNGQIISNPLRTLIQDLDSLPFPDKELYYEKFPFFREDYRITTSRGCIFNCTYCYNNVLRKVYSQDNNYFRRRSMENVLQELNLAKAKYKIKRVQFYDDTFTADSDWLREFSLRYKKEIDLPCSVSVHPQTVNKPVLDCLKRLSCFEIQMGVQSLNPGIRRDVLHRDYTEAKIEQAIRLFTAADIKCVVDNMSGLLGEVEDDFIYTIKFYNKVRPHRISDYYLSYYPKTDILEMARKQGVLTDEKIVDLETGLASRPFALGGTFTKFSIDERLHFFMALFSFLPQALNEFILAKKLYRFFPKKPYVISVIRRILDIKSKKDINAQRYYQRYSYYFLQLFKFNWIKFLKNFFQ